MCKHCATKTRNMSFARPEGSTRKKGKYIEQKVGKKWVFQHRIIAEETIGRRIQDDEAVHHIDGDATNNVPENLLVMDHAMHTVLHHTGSKRSKETCRKIVENRKKIHIPQKLSTLSVLIIREMSRCGVSYSKLAQQYGVSKGSIASIVKRKIWRHV